MTDGSAQKQVNAVDHKETVPRSSTIPEMRYMEEKEGSAVAPLDIRLGRNNTHQVLNPSIWMRRKEASSSKYEKIGMEIEEKILSASLPSLLVGQPIHCPPNYRSVFTLLY